MKSQDATAQALQLRSQGLKYSDITEHLARAGFKSPRTQRPYTEMGVRYMVGAAEKARTEDRDEVMKVTTATISEVVKKLVDLPGVAEEVKLQLIEALIASSRRKA